VENVEFRALLEAPDHSYPVQSRTPISEEIDKVLVDMKNNIQEYICKAQRVSLCTNVSMREGSCVDITDPLTNNSKTLLTSSVGSKLQAIVLDPTIRYEELVLKYNAYVVQSLNNSKVDVLDRLW